MAKLREKKKKGLSKSESCVQGINNEGAKKRKKKKTKQAFVFAWRRRSLEQDIYFVCLFFFLCFKVKLISVIFFFPRLLSLMRFAALLCVCVCAPAFVWVCRYLLVVGWVFLFFFFLLLVIVILLSWPSFFFFISSGPLFYIFEFSVGWLIDRLLLLSC